jgi:hypothetical protein
VVLVTLVMRATTRRMALFFMLTRSGQWVQAPQATPYRPRAEYDV